MSERTDDQQLSLLCEGIPQILSASWASGESATDPCGYDKEAESRLYKRLEEVNAGKYQAPSEYVTVEEMVAAYLKNHVTAKGVEPETLKEYERTAELHIHPHIGKLVARNVRRVQVETWRNDLQKKEVQLTEQAKTNRAKAGLKPRVLSPRTIGKAMELLSASYRYGMSHEWVLRDPTLGVARPTKRSTGAELSRAQSASLTFEELQRYFAAAADDDDRLLLMFAAYTGMREAELCGLGLDEVNLNTCTARIVRTWRRGRFKVPKTAHSIREVYFPTELVPELRRRKLECPKGEHRLMFPTATGGPMNPANILHRIHYPTLKRAGLRKVRFHDLRHTFATLALADEQSLGGVSHQLGHKDTAITQRVYRHVMPGEAKGIGDALAARVAAATPADGGKTVAKKG